MTISRISIKDENELRSIVVDDISVVEDGLSVVCTKMPMDSKTIIDILCVDDNGQLVILKLSTKENDDIFFEGLKIITHVTSVIPILKFSYKDFKINDSKQPRLVFLAPSYSPQLVGVVGQMQGIQMDLYTWEYFEFDDKRALHLEPAWLSESTKSKPKKPKTRKQEPKKQEPPKPESVTKEVVVPPEEIQSRTPPKDEKVNKKKSIFSI